MPEVESYFNTEELKEDIPYKPEESSSYSSQYSRPSGSYKSQPTSYRKPIKTYPATKPAEISYETPSEDEYDAPLFYKSKENKKVTTQKPTPGPTYYKALDESDQTDTYQQFRSVRQPGFKSSPHSVDHDPSNEFGTKSPNSKTEKEPQSKKVYKSSFKILDKPVSERRKSSFYNANERIGGFEDSFEESNDFDFPNTGFLDDAHFASGMWDMFDDDGSWGQKIQ